MDPRIRRRAAGTAGAVAALLGATLVMPSEAHAATTCKTLRGTVYNAQGQTGGRIQATLCTNPSTGNGYFDEGYYNYVEDLRADGVAARAYVTHSHGFNGPLEVDDTSTPGGQPISWETTLPSTGIKVVVCLGTKYPGTSGARCATAS